MSVGKQYNRLFLLLHPFCSLQRKICNNNIVLKTGAAEAGLVIGAKAVDMEVIPEAIRILIQEATFPKEEALGIRI